MSLTCPLCTLGVIQHVRDLLADEEAIFVSSEIIDWLDEQIDLQMKLLVTIANGMASKDAVAMRLMATAPKLLVALIAASDWIDAQVGLPRTEIQAIIHEAIAEATGCPTHR